jgi:D-glycero-D-manno-heptose 1,7-bisphosphate phosphatase
MSKRATFIDRDGTIIDDTHYLSRPELVRLLPGAAKAISRLHDAGWSVIMVTNQSGIARGLLSLADYERVHARMVELLAAEGAHLDASYMCPHHPDFDGDCDCRKPGTLLFQQAAAEHSLDVGGSSFIGDRWRDVAPALQLGGRGILIDTESTPVEDRRRAEEAKLTIVSSLAEAADAALVG